MSDSNKEGVTCIGDAFSLWRLEVDADTGPMRLFYFQSEGGSLSAEHREEIFSYYREQILSEKKPYTQLFDLRNGVEDAARHLLPLAEFCRSIRNLQKEFLHRTLLISNDSLTCGVIRCVLRMAPPVVPFIICGTEEEAWRNLMGSLDAAVEVWAPPAEEGCHPASCDPFEAGL